MLREKVGQLIVSFHRKTGRKCKSETNENLCRLSSVTGCCKQKNNALLHFAIVAVVDYQTLLAQESSEEFHGNDVVAAAQSLAVARDSL